MFEWLVLVMMVVVMMMQRFEESWCVCVCLVRRAGSGEGCVPRCELRWWVG